MDSQDITLPVGWTLSTIEEVTEPVAKVDPSLRSVEEFTYLDISSIDNKENKIVDPKYYLGADAPSRARQKVQGNDVLFSTVRTYLKNIALVPEKYDGQIASTGFCVLRGRKGIALGPYLFYYTLTADFLEQLSALQRGVSYPAVRDQDVKAQTIPLAPLPEQQRIVDAIEALFSRLDAAVAALRRVQANLKRYRAALLKAACEGRLVPTEAELARAEGRPYEPAADLLARILAERRAQWQAANPGKKYKEPSPPDTSTLPELPEGWCWASVEQLNPANRACAYGVLQPGPDIENGVALVRVGDIDDSGMVSTSELKRIAPSIASQYKRTILRGGEVLMSLVGAIGRTAVVPEELAGANTARAVGVIPLSSHLSPYWVEIWFRNPAMVSKMMGLAHEVARKTLNLEDVRKAAVAIPPYDEQARILQEVSRRESIAQEVEASASHSLLRANRLRQAILQRAFAGQLVPQEPDALPVQMPLLP